ncbi:MAG: FAD-binding oxidoreductase [Candidatus Spechtbacterales bacterium]
MNVDKLKSLIKGDVETSDKLLEEYSTDASLFKIRPSALVFPKDADDVKKTIRFIAENKKQNPELSITARSAGTDMSGGPLSESVVMVFTRYMNEFSIDEASRTARVQPGVYYRDFEKETLKHGLILPSYPASKSIAALGGMVNNNSGGEKSIRYGKTERYVKKLKMVLSDGNEYEFKKLNRDELTQIMLRDDLYGEVHRKMYEITQNSYDIVKEAKPDVAKNSAGYSIWNIWDRDIQEFDLTQLFVGAQGTLGIMTEAEIELVAPEPRKKMIVLFMRDLKELPEIVNEILPLQPEGMEAFDDETLKMAIRFFPDIAKKVHENLISFLFKFIPEGLVTLRMRGFPKMTILIQFAEATNWQAEAKLAEAEKRLKRFKAIKKVIHDDRDAEKYRVIRRESFALLREHVRGKRTAPFIDDFIVNPEYLPEVLPKVYKILEEYGIHKTIAGHAGSGNFHIIPLMDLSSEEEKAKIPAVSEKIYDLILQYKGSITAEHNDGLVRSPYLEKMFGSEVYNLFKQTKHIFDPDNIFNPGKKVNASMGYAMNHIEHK